MPNNQDVAELEDSTSGRKLRPYKKDSPSRIIDLGKGFQDSDKDNIYKCESRSTSKM
jgi:hypothetical protein